MTDSPNMKRLKEWMFDNDLSRTDLFRTCYNKFHRHQPLHEVMGELWDKLAEEIEKPVLLDYKKIDDEEIIMNNCIRNIKAQVEGYGK